MNNTFIRDFQVRRLRQIPSVTSNDNLRRIVPSEQPDRDLNLPDDELALVAALVVRISRRLGRTPGVLPRVVHQALADLVGQGDPTARLLHAWLDQSHLTDCEIMDGARQPDTWRTRPSPSRHSPHARIYRHQRFWRPGSARLADLDRARIRRLRDLLAREMRHEH